MSALALAALAVMTFRALDFWHGLPAAVGLYEPLAFVLGGTFFGWAGARIAWLRRGILAAVAAVAALVVPFGDWLAVAFLLSAATLLAWPWTAQIGRGRLTIAVLAGLAVSGGAVGWLLPLRIHFAPVYLGALVAIGLWRRRALGEVYRYARQRLVTLRGDARRVAGEAAAAMGAAAGLLGWLLVASGLPRVQWDDLAYHLWLPYQLFDRGGYSFDAGSNVWAVAPWLGDIWAALLMLVKGGEPRALMNWALLLAAGRLVWLLATACRAHGLARWLALLCFFSVPITVQVMHGMQAELPSAALLMAVLWLLASRWFLPDPPAPRDWVVLGALAGGLLALKASNVMFIAPIALLSLVPLRRAPQIRLPLMAAATALAVGAASYVYAWLVTGNPVLPLFNPLFKSPFFDASAAFTNPRYTGQFNAAALYNFVFRSGLMAEAEAPIGGFHLALLLPLAALGLRRSRLCTALLIATLLGALALFSQQQYVRYMYPAMPMIGVAIGSGARVMALAARGWISLLTAAAAGLALLLNVMLAHQSMGIFRDGVIAHSPLAGQQATNRFEEEIAGEKAIAERLRAEADFERMRVLAPFIDRPFVATFGAQGVWGVWQNYRLARQITGAVTDATGGLLREALLRQGISHVLFHAVPDEPAWRALFSRLGQPQMKVGLANLVRLRLADPLTAVSSKSDSILFELPPDANRGPGGRRVADIDLALICVAGVGHARLTATWTVANGVRSSETLGVRECAGGLAHRISRSIDVPPDAIAIELSAPAPGFRLEDVEVRLRPDLNVPKQRFLSLPLLTAVRGDR